MENLLKYLEDNYIKFEVEDKFGLINIDGKLFDLIKPDSDGKLIDNETLLHTALPTEADYYVYSFGGKYYYRPSGDEELTIKFNELKYMGESTSPKGTCDIFLGVHDGFDTLNGSRLAPDWVKKAKFMGITHLGFCNRNTLAGALKFQLECKNNGIIPIFGETFLVSNPQTDKTYEVKMYVENEAGWENLLALNRIVNVDKRDLLIDDIGKHFDGLTLIFDPKEIAFEDVPFRSFYYQLDSCEYLNDEDDKWYLENLRKFVRADQSNCVPVVLNDAYYLDKEHAFVKSVLNGVASKPRKETKNQYFKSFPEYIKELNELFGEQDSEWMFQLISYAVANTKAIAERCKFNVKTTDKHLPKYEMNEEEKVKYKDNEDMFWSLIEDGIRKQVKPEDYAKYVERVKTEAKVIESGGFIDYFLTLYDIIQYANKNGIMTGIGRGSAGGSVISMLLGLIKLDPLDFDLLFERFLNAGRIGSYEDDTKIVVQSDNGPVEYWHDDRLRIIRKGAYYCIDAKELESGDEIIKKY